MQHRMKLNPMPSHRIHKMLEEEAVGRFVTIGPDGYPYAIPVHFVHYQDKIYFHGLPRGQKLDNLRANPRVCFEVDKMYGYLKEGVDMPCNVNTDYESIIIIGDAIVLEDVELKKTVLKAVVAKLTPDMSDMKIPDKMVMATAVVEITVKECTGKYYNQATLNRDNA